MPKDERKTTGKGMDSEDSREKVESWTKSVVVCDLPAGPIRAACAAAERMGEKWPGRSGGKWNLNLQLNLRLFRRIDAYQRV
jgi:hypothetical protein